jgi:uncharacterized membrane protein
MILQLLAVLVRGLMCGSELNVALFAHATLNRQPLEVHVLMRSSFAELFGRVMPFWMAGSAVLNLLLLLPFEHRNKLTSHLAAVSLRIQIFAVFFSLVGAVPINKRIAKWAPASLLKDWRTPEHQWDIYHWIRTCGLVVAFVLLILSVRFR